MQHNRDTGSVIAVGISATAAGGGAAIRPGSSTPAAAVAVVSCPRWFYCGNNCLTCLLPASAGHALRLFVSEEAEGISPDALMRGVPAAKERARKYVRKLYKLVKQQGFHYLIHKMGALDEEDLGKRQAIRHLLKSEMHKVGLGLRHSRVWLEEAKRARHYMLDEVVQAVACPRVGSLAHNAVGNLRA